MTAPSVSIIVPCFNGEPHIGACLAGLTRQTYPEYEVVVVDDASRDGTARVLKDFPFVKVVQNAENRGPGFSRNRGIEASGGDLLVFVDSDCVVDDADWLGKHVEVQERLGGAILGGGVVGTGRGMVARADAYCHWLTNIPYGEVRTVTAETRGRVRFSRHLVTTNLSVPRRLVQQIGPFDEDLRTGEDLEFCERALATGLSLRLEPRIALKHRDRERVRDFFECFYRTGKDRVPARRRHRSQYHQLMPTSVVGSLLMCVPIALLMPLQTIRAWWPFDKRVALYYPLIALASFAMGLGIVAYCIRQARGAR
ncbi:MAG TPA: glycosyltransferase [Candidatus Nitrosotalea sp.]|nr:glycosyltransferase [Candidatus Nitrosotalea sp.]